MCVTQSAFRRTISASYNRKPKVRPEAHSRNRGRDMTQVIVAGALGVAIIITGGLFLRRFLGELAALRDQLTEYKRQITEIDKEMRAQRAHVTVLRQLLASEEGDADGPPPQAAVVNGHNGDSPPTAGRTPDAPHLVRRKGHLGLYIGGAAAALTALTTAARDAARAHGAHMVGAAAGAAVTAATVTAVTVQPWTHDVDYRPPSAASSASAPPTYAPPGSTPPRPPGSIPPTPSSSLSASASPASPSPTDDDSATPSGVVSPRDDTSPAGVGKELVDAIGDLLPAGGTLPGTSAPEPSPQEPAQTPSPSPPATADSGLCVGASVPVVLETEACLLGS